MVKATDFTIFHQGVFELKVLKSAVTIVQLPSPINPNITSGAAITINGVLYYVNESIDEVFSGITN